MAKNLIATSQGVRSLVVNEEHDPDFIYYLLLHNTDYFKQHASGSTFQELSGSTLKFLEFLIPPLSEQRAIAHILGSLDDKIELNRRMNKTLEAMARAIFKSWFVDFLPDEISAPSKKDVSLAGDDPTIPFLSELKFPKPSSKLIDIWHKYCDDIFKRQDLLLRESRTLSLLRYTLLPKLISGELRLPAAALQELAVQAGVSDAEKFAGEASVLSSNN